MTDDDLDQPIDERPLVRIDFPAGEGPLESVALLTLDRPEAHNALSFALVAELGSLLAVLDEDPACRAIVITGAGEKAFAAGADIRELAGRSPRELQGGDPFAVAGPDRAPGHAGHRRGPRVRAGRRLRAGDGLRHDRRRRRRAVRPARDQARGDPRRGRHAAADAGDRQGAGDGADPHRVAGSARGRRRRGASSRWSCRRRRRWSGRSSWPAGSPRCRRSPWRPRRRPSIAAQGMSLAQGLHFERERFEALFGTEDQREGMIAFLEKRTPSWTGR